MDDENHKITNARQFIQNHISVNINCNFDGDHLSWFVNMSIYFNLTKYNDYKNG